MNLSLHANIKRLMKVHCAGIDRDVSDLTEELYRKFLQAEGVRIEETPESTVAVLPHKKVSYSARRRKK